MSHFLFLCLITLGLANKEHDSINIAEIKNGKIRGRSMTSIQNKTIHMFLQIPYGQPPIGNLRFKDPLPAKNWTGVLNATLNTKICWERPSRFKKMDLRYNEDCLYLNVYSPVPPGPKKVLLPVFVYIYGGQYMTGELTLTAFDPQQFVDADIVAVTLNFRSGPLGFLTTEDGVISANRGLKDQHLALKWVQDNIHIFGGDPAKVTLVGHSSGAMCVTYQVLSSKTTGLFRAAIIQSGTALTPLSYSQKARLMAFEMGRQLSPKFSYENTSEDLLKILAEAPIEKMTLMTFPHLLMENNALEKLFEKINWGPVIEKPDIPNAYLTRLPHDSQLTGDFQRVPILTGITSEEFLYHEDLSVASKLNRGTVLFEVDSIKWGFRNIVEERIRRLYGVETFEENPYAAIKYLSDYIFSIGSIRFAELHARYADVYFYKFSYLGKINELVWKHATNINGLDNVSHGEELPYLLYFHGKAVDFHKFPKSDLLTQKKMIKFWTNFVKYMNPTPGQEKLTDYIKWPTLPDNGFKYVDINANLSVIKDFPRPLYKEWVKMINEYYRHPLGYL